MSARQWILSQSSGCQFLNVSGMCDHLVVLLAAVSHDIPLIGAFSSETIYRHTQTVLIEKP
jgi:hypothetical protein